MIETRSTTRPFKALRLEDEDFTNPRLESGLDAESIRELAISIGANGLWHPLMVKPNDTIVGGQRRYRAIYLLISDPGALAESAGESSVVFEQRATKLEQDVPVIVVQGDTDEYGPGPDAAEIDGIALADNLLHAELSSYEIAERVMRMHHAGASVTKIGTLIGKSKSFVSRITTTWRMACPELHEAWAAGQLPFEHVKQISELPPEQQRAKLVPPPNGGAPRRSRGRPGIENVKHRIKAVTAHYGAARSVQPRSYCAGVLDALRWVADSGPSEEWAEFTQPLGGDD